MDQTPLSSLETNGESSTPTETPAIVYPPKYEKTEQPANIWLKSVTSLALYLVLGYYIFPSYNYLLVITAIVIIHELGHFFAMKFFRYKDLGIFFIPLLGAYVSGSKREVSQRQSAIILLAGPLPGVLFGIILFLVDQKSDGLYFLHMELSQIGILFLLLNLINLFPIYPLDGGQLLNRVFLDEESLWSKIFVFISIALMCWLAIKLPFYPLLIFPAIMLLRFFGDKKIDSIEKKIEAEGINTDIEYHDLPDKDYWKIRDILAREHSGFNDLVAGPPYVFTNKEEKVMVMIQGFLHRHLIQDVSLLGKLFIFLIWIAAFAAPWLVNMDVAGYFSRIRF
jgi:stage IV sporulation protein FB